MFGPDYIVLGLIALCVLGGVVTFAWPERGPDYRPETAGGNCKLPATLPHPGPKAETRK